MMTTENLIPLVHSKPEIWDQTCENYSSKEMKLKAWKEIAETLSVTVNAAKLRWTNLRDLFRRELKKSMKMARETGDPEAYVPRWKNFKTMLFLKDQMVKNSETQYMMMYDDTFSSYPHIDNDEIDKAEAEYFAEEEYSAGIMNEMDMTIVPDVRTSKRKAVSNGYDHTPTQKMPKHHRSDDQSLQVNNYDEQPQSSSNALSEMDGDYHFLMSLLPSVRKIQEHRKTSFKMKMLHLIMEEERYNNE